MVVLFLLDSSKIWVTEPQKMDTIGPPKTNPCLFFWVPSKKTPHIMGVSPNEGFFPGGWVLDFPVKPSDQGSLCRDGLIHKNTPGFTPGEISPQAFDLPSPEAREKIGHTTEFTPNGGSKFMWGIAPVSHRKFQAEISEFSGEFRCSTELGPQSNNQSPGE